ncbi:hypothetical protein AVT20_gp59 [Mycobacterium phage Tiffany]|nr:hypothetical protein AVT20_gp59 [Mycobacterium phage Tiffany]AIK68990.1 hypothetical protein PBI_TIFFANY_40 [Mycobacterium phage Tiffany]
MHLVLYGLGFEVSVRARRREQPRPSVFVTEGGVLPVEEVAEILKEVI